MHVSRIFLLLALALAPLCAVAQVDEIETEFRKLDDAERQRLRGLLDMPTPASADRPTLAAFFDSQEAAAVLLGEPTLREKVLREAVSLLPNPGYKRNLGQTLNALGQFDEGNSLLRQAIKDGGAIEAAMASSSLMCDLVQQNRNDEARDMARQVDRRITMAKGKAANPMQKVKVIRAAARRDLCMAQLEGRIGRTAQAVEFAKSGGANARAAMELFASLDNQTMKNGVLGDVANSVGRKMDAYLGADRLHEAELALQEYLRLAREVQLPAKFLSDMYRSAAQLRFAQRAFGPSEQFARRSDAVLAQMGLEPQQRQRLARSRDVLAALVGQKKWDAAQAEIDRLDALTTGDPAMAQQVRNPLYRGLTYLHTQRADAAANLFEVAAALSRKNNGDTHFFTAQNVGLQGAALWASANAASKGRALPLLKAAVRDYMAPANADFVETLGVRKEIREIVFTAYLEAAAQAGKQEAIDALGPADWARGGVVKDALNDAAVRSAASTPALADVVRREQDAKNEIAGLRRYLSGDVGGSDSPLPQVAAQMRARIDVLEAERARLQSEIKAKFPSYDDLIHPKPPTAREISRQLSADQALVLLLPAADAVYVWAVASDRSAGFVRAKMPQTQVTALVERLRKQLDFGTQIHAGKRFDGASAFALYDQLLAPLAPVLGGKTQLIIAAGGALSQIPFGLLHTRAGGGFDETAPWLIRDASVTQVPSLSAWMAIKALARTPSAPQAFAGWGDPVFDLQRAIAPQPASATRNVTLTRAMALSDIALETAMAGTPATVVASISAIKYGQIPVLPETRDELLAIALTLKSDASNDLLLGAQATRASVLQASKGGQLLNKRVIAFATHGLMAGDLPGLTQPALALAALGNEDKEPLGPLLTLEDVLTLKLNADWVVLSACNTAAEDGRGDEAMSGLARGFFYAGSRSLLVTHWAVESESAKMLTTATFAHYAANPQAPKAESLRQAMLQVMALPQFRHPAFWAPYALVGDGGR